jgi:hypothetical protein
MANKIDLGPTVCIHTSHAVALKELHQPALDCSTHDKHVSLCPIPPPHPLKIAIMTPLQTPCP